MPFFFQKLENKKVKQVLGGGGGWHQWEGQGYKERVLEGEYGKNIMYSCVKMEK
jgi:hypothetical protein